MPNTFDDLVRSIVREELTRLVPPGLLTPPPRDVDLVAAFLGSHPPEEVRATELHRRFLEANPDLRSSWSVYRLTRRAMATGLVSRRHARDGERYRVLGPAGATGGEGVGCHACMEVSATGRRDANGLEHTRARLGGAGATVAPQPPIADPMALQVALEGAGLHCYAVEDVTGGATDGVPACLVTVGVGEVARARPIVLDVLGPLIRVGVVEGVPESSAGTEAGALLEAASKRAQARPLACAGAAEPPRRSCQWCVRGWTVAGILCRVCGGVGATGEGVGGG